MLQIAKKIKARVVIGHNITITLPLSIQATSQKFVTELLCTCVCVIINTDRPSCLN